MDGPRPASPPRKKSKPAGKRKLLAGEHAEGRAALAQRAQSSARSEEGRAQIADVEVALLRVAEGRVPDDGVRGRPRARTVHRVDQVALVVWRALQFDHR